MQLNEKAQLLFVKTVFSVQMSFRHQTILMLM